MRVSPIINSLNSGEWSEKMWGRTDLAQYPSACRKMRNFVMLVHGGATRTPGTEYIAETKDSQAGRDKKARLIPFQFNTEQAYVMEVGDQYARLYKDKAQILNDDDSPVQVGMNFREDELFDFRYVQDKDLMYFFHRSYPTTQLTRTSHTIWQMEDVDFEDGPYLPPQRILDSSVNLLTNGDMEDDSNWTEVGTTLLCEQSNFRAFEQSYSWHILSETGDDGVQSDAFTTETGKTYRLRLRIYTAAGTFKLKIHQGNDSGTWSLEETIENVPLSEWTEYERYWEEAAGGTGAYIQVLTALTAVIEGYESQYPPAYSANYVKATSISSSIRQAAYATDPSTLLTGDANNRSWTSNSATNQRFHIDVGEKKLIRRIYYENYHHFGTYNIVGVKNFTFWGSNDPDSFAELTYGTDTGWTEIVVGQNTFDKHVNANQTDPKYIAVTPTTKYRYYAFKFADNYGYGGGLGVRRIELQEAKYEDDANIWVDKVEVNNVEATTLTPSVKTGHDITLTAGADLFTAGHIGAFFRLTHGETTGYVRIIAVNSATEAVADVISDLGDTTATIDWLEGAWSTKNGFPACGTFYEQRLIAASTNNDPDGVWGSKPTEYEDFAPGSLATDAFGYKLQSDIIRWVCPMGQLVVGTVRNEYMLGSPDSGALDARDVKLTQRSRKGTANIEPISMGNAVLFVQRYGDSENYGRKVRELNYDLATESYVGNDLTIFAEHITGSGIVDWAYMDSPFPILWCATADGDLIGMTYDKEQKVIGWHKHPTNGDVESVCVIPGEKQDQLWMIVKRTINGATKRFIEVMADFEFDTLADAFFVDCGLTYSGPATTTISGLDHLEGEALDVLADGVVVTGKTVESGAITLDTAASKVHAGLPKSRTYIETVDFDEGSREGTGQGKQKRMHSLALRLYQTVGGKVGISEGTLEDIKYPPGTAGLYTGLTQDMFALGGWQKDVCAVVEQPDPLPMTVLTIMPRYRLEDK
mgnify:CR=1 FL=1